LPLGPQGKEKRAARRPPSLLGPSRAAGCWLLAAGCWLLAAGGSGGEMGHQRLATASHAARAAPVYVREYEAAVRGTRGPGFTRAIATDRGGDGKQPAAWLLGPVRGKRLPGGARTKTHNHAMPMLRPRVWSCVAPPSGLSPAVSFALLPPYRQGTGVAPAATPAARGQKPKGPQRARAFCDPAGGTIAERQV
jgi:hypothetical protein